VLPVANNQQLNNGTKMELKWLKDFIALADHKSFSKAAESRFVTQPAFSRRIRSLENWLDVNLVDRNQYPTQLTSAGQAFINEAYDLIEKIDQSREHVRSIESSQDQVMLLAQHALTVAFFPAWIKALKPLIKDTTLRVDTGNLHDIIEKFIAGNTDFLLAYAAPISTKQTSNDPFQQLYKQGVESLTIGYDTLMPVCAVDNDGLPLHTLANHLNPAEQVQTIRLLSHPAESFFGQLIDRECLPQLSSQINFQTICENALSEGLKALTLQGDGMAWLPKNLIIKELANKQLFDLSDTMMSVALTIKLYRIREARHPTAKLIWAHLQTQTNK
jgi:DNA-binding transcriptional LysR family regulator